MNCVFCSLTNALDEIPAKYLVVGWSVCKAHVETAIKANNEGLNARTLKDARDRVSL